MNALISFEIRYSYTFMCVHQSINILLIFYHIFFASKPIFLLSVFVLLSTPPVYLFRIQQERKEMCHVSLVRSREVREKRAQMYTRLKPLPTTSTKHTPSRGHTTGSIPQGSRSKRIQAEALATREGIEKFEAGLSLPVSMDSRPHSTGGTRTAATATQSKGPTSDYVTQIRKRVQDNEHARKVRALQ